MNNLHLGLSGLFLACHLALAGPVPATDSLVLVEAESFTEPGGWLVDQQFMDFMGSPYMLAHGLGIPVPDASTSVGVPAPGEYRVWVRTRDWVAPWKAPGAPGRFQILIDGKPLDTTFGTEGAEWHWQDGGTVKLGPEAKLTMHDLTGFDGRCDAILLSRDASFTPPDGGPELEKLRGRLLGWDKEPTDGGRYDLVVVGGGIAGTSAAIAAARLGMSVALVQDRPVLGGNGSSEVRVWPEGHTNHEPYPRIGDVVRELVRKKGKGDGNARDGHIYEDRRKLDLVRAEPNITLLLEHRVNNATARDKSVASVIAQHTRSGQRKRLTARWFLDSSGDGVVGALVGADLEMTMEGHMGVSNLWNVGNVEKNEYQLKCECEDDDPLSLNFVASNEAAPFPRCPWAVDLSDKPFPGRKPAADGSRAAADLSKLGGWFWETGFDRHPITDLERMRDQNLRAMFGAWDTLKNVDKQYPNQRLKWAAFIAGKRESRRLLGDVILTGPDFREMRPYEDAAFPCTWHIDLHFPKEDFQAGHEGDEFISDFTRGKGYKYKGPYWAPYRCLYSRNIDNLFMAGRDISVNHEALGAVRVMQTCGMMGEIVGMAASLCKKHECTPREVYQNHLPELKKLMKRGAGKTSPKKKLPPVFAPVEDVAGLPRVLLIGDSISIAYTLPVREFLQGKANVHRPATNCGPTTRGIEELDAWLATGGTGKKWDVIHFNWGLHDLKYLGANGANLADPKAPGSHQQVRPGAYEQNMRNLVKRLARTGAHLIWRNTTPVPEGAKGRVPGDAAKYNAIAAGIMQEHGILTDDLFAFAQAQLSTIQQPANVHFTPAGSRDLAKQVAGKIEATLKRE